MSLGRAALLLGWLLSAPARAEEGPEDLDLVFQIAVEPLFSTLRFSFDGRQLVQTTESQRRVWDIESGLLIEEKTRRSSPGDGVPRECAEEIEPCDARAGLLAQASDRTLVVSRGRQEVLRCTLEVGAGGVALSPGGDRVAIAADDWLGIVKTGAKQPADGRCLGMLETRRPFPSGSARLAFSPDGSLLAAGLEGGVYAGARERRRWGAPLQLLVASDLSVGRSLGVRLEDQGDRLQISSDGRHVLVFGLGLDGARWDLDAATYGPATSGLLPVSKGAMAAEQPALLAGVMGRWFAAFDGAGLGILSHDGARFGAASNSAPLALLPARGGGWEADAAGDLLAVAGTCAWGPSPDPGLCSAGGPASELLLTDVRKGELARWTLPEGGLCELADVAVDPRDRSVLAIRACGDSVDDWKRTRDVVRLRPGHVSPDPLSAAELPADAEGLSFERIAAAPDGTGLALATSDRVCLSIPDEDIDPILDTTYGTCYGVSPNSDSRIVDIALTQGSKRLFILLDSGAVEIHGARGWHEHIATLFPVGVRDYAIVLSDGIYKATPPGLDLLAFRAADGAVLPASWLDPWLHQPGEVLERLGYADGDYVERVRQETEVWRDRMGQTWVDASERPEIVAAGAALNGHDRTLRLDPIETGGVSGPYKLDVRVNGVPWRGVESLNVSGATTGRWGPLDVPLRVGSNRVDVVAVDALGRRSFPRRFDVLVPGVVGRRVWFLGVAVESYDELKKLNWTVEDVHGLWAAIKSSTNLPADNPAPVFLEGPAVTRESVSALAARVADAGPDDLVILAVSGHGLSDDNGNWYFAPSTLRPDDPGATGISYASLEAIFARTPALQRLLVIDACHAGPGSAGGGLEGGKGGLGSKATRQVSTTRQDGVLPFLEHDRGLGVQALVASASWQAAWEDEDAAGGLFTSALASGLSSFSADLDGNGDVSLNEWLDQAQREVEGFTAGTQRPTARALSREGDFVVVTGVAPSTRRDLCVGQLQSLCGDGGAVVAIDGERDELLIAHPNQVDSLSRVSIDGRTLEVITSPSLDQSVAARQPPTLHDGLLRWGWLSTGGELRLLEREPKGIWGEIEWAGQVFDEDRVVWVGHTMVVSWPGRSSGWGEVHDRGGRLVARWQISSVPRAVMASGDRAVTLESDGRLIVRALPSGAELLSVDGPFVALLALSGSGRRAIVETSAGGTIELSLDAGPPKLRARPLDLGDARWIYPISIDDDGSITGVFEGTLLLWGPW